jgi:hypothetical protein
MSEIAQKLSRCALLLMLVPACDPEPAGEPDPVGSGTVEDPWKTGWVQYFNCNRADGATFGRAYNVFTVAPGDVWVPRGGLNPQPGSWTDCHDEAHTGASLTVDLTNPAGLWKVYLVKLPTRGEPDCDSSIVEGENSCEYIVHYFQTDLTQAQDTITKDMKEN